MDWGLTFPRVNSANSLLASSRAFASVRMPNLPMLMSVLLRLRTNVFDPPWERECRSSEACRPRTQFGRSQAAITTVVLHQKMRF